MIVPLITIPYQYKNKIAESGSITIDTTDYPLCGDKFFDFKPIRVSSDAEGVGEICIFYIYDSVEYGTNSLSIDDYFALINRCYECPNDCNCNQQEAGFSYALTPYRAKEWVSSEIVKAVGSGNKTYSLSTITVNGISYTPATIWNDAAEATRASDTPRDYIAEIITYIEGLSIPEYKGAYNKAVNNSDDNHLGDGLLSLYFESTATVSIVVTISGVVTGSFAEAGLTTTTLVLELTNTSTINPSDNITGNTWIATDGERMLANYNSIDFDMLVWTIQTCSASLNPNDNWVVNLVIQTENECYVNNVSTAILKSSDILKCISTGTPISGNGY